MNEYELEEIKREIVESRSLSIKSNNLVNALAADIKSIAKRQQSQERRAVFNSATAYVVTIAVVLLFVKLAWDLRLDAVRSETEEAKGRITELEKEIKNLQAREDSRLRSARLAGDFYELVAQNKRREVLEGYENVKKLDLSPTERALFDAAYERARNELSLIAYQSGLDHVRSARWHEAQEQFRESLKLKNDAAHSPNASYQLARCMVALGNQRDAIPILMQLSEASPDKEVMDEATFLLAQAQLDIKAYNDAKTTLRAFLRRFPTSAHALAVKAKLAEVQLYH